LVERLPIAAIIWINGDVKTEAQARLASDAMVTARLECLIDNGFLRVDSGHYIVSNKGRKVLRVFTKLRHFLRSELETVDLQPGRGTEQCR
jgi:hypothetical protein